MATYLCNTNVTLEIVQESLLNALCHDQQCKPKLVKWEADEIGLQTGLMSHIVRLEMQWEKSSVNLPNFVVLKIPTAEECIKAMDTFSDTTDAEANKKMEVYLEKILVPEIHQRECLFYDLIRGQSQLPVPINYCHISQCTEDFSGFICMEDLSRGKLVNMADGLNVQQLLNLADALASFHAYCFRQQGWEEKFYLRTSSVSDMIKGAAARLSKSHPQEFEKRLLQIDKCFDGDFLHRTSTSHKALNLPPVLVHGDLWTNNIIFEATVDGRAGSKVLGIVDWQVVFSGNLALDLATVLVRCSNSLVRRKYESLLLMYYYERLAEHIAANNTSCTRSIGSSNRSNTSTGPKSVIPFSYVQLLEAYNTVFPVAVAYLLFALPIMIEGPVCSGDSVKQSKLVDRGCCAIDDLLKFLP